MLNRENMRSREMGWIAVFAFVMIPLGSWLLATRESPFNHTFSHIGNSAGYKMAFIIWGIVTGLLISFLVIRLYILHSFDNVRARKLLVWSLIFLIITVLLPSMDTLPYLYEVHTLMAVSFAISLMMSLYLFIQFLNESHQKLFNWSMSLLIFIIGGTVICFFIFGNTGIFELFFFFSLTFFLYFLDKTLT
jgi:hypothetical protein